MPKRVNRAPAAKPKEAEPDFLKGWQQIASFLGQPLSVAQHWAKTGMPVARQGRSVVASPAQLNAWLGRESGGEPVHIAQPEADLTSELRRDLSYLRGQKRSRRRRR
jgi:hypothetical protein